MKQLISKHKLNRLQLLAKRWNKQGKTQKLSQKIQRLATELQTVFTLSTLRKTLGAAAILLGTTFSQQATAQDDISFANGQANPFGLNQIADFIAPNFVDLDGDGDMDILAATYSYNENYLGYFQFFENIGTAETPNFAAPQQDPFGLFNPSQYGFIPTTADLDSDGDMDIVAFSVSAYGESSSLQYFENIGTAEAADFAQPQANPYNMQVTSENIAIPTFVDLDADGDMDLLIGEYYGNMSYQENVGTAEEPSFAAPQQNPFGLSATNDYAIPVFADLDKDGDMDLIVMEYSGSMQYFENKGTAEEPSFGVPITNPFGFAPMSEYAIFPTVADLDADGDMDLLIGEYDYGNLYYYENTTPVVNVGIESEVVFETTCTVFPNPTSDFVQIKTKEQVAKVEISDVSGKIIGTYTDISRPISMQHLAKGLYSLKIVNNDGAFVTKMVQKQ